MGERVVLEGVKRVLAIASGKGGVGKSTVSVNLALALQGLGYTVGLFDGDVHGPNIPLMLGVRRREKAEGFAGFVAVALSRDYEKKVPKGTPLERFGLKIMSLGLLVGEDQPIIPDSNLVGRMVMQVLRSVDWNGLDFLLIDLPPGTGEPQITFSQRLYLDGVVLVTTPPDVALLDTTKALNLYRDRGIAVLGLVENMSYYICPECGDHREIFPRSQREDERGVRAKEVPVLGRIPLAPAVGTAGDNGQPLVVTDPQGQVAQAFLEAARQVAAAVEKLPAERDSGPGPSAPEHERPAPGRVPSTRFARQSRSGAAGAAAFATGFHSDYLENLAADLLERVRLKLDSALPALKQDEASMRVVVETYREIYSELNLTLSGPLQKELIGYIMQHLLPGAAQTES